MPGDVPVGPLMNTKEAEQLGRDLVRGSAACALPKEGVKVVGPAEDRALADVKCLGEGLEVEQTIRQL